MFIFTKQLLITLLMLITALFGCSTILASQTAFTPMVVNSITYYQPEILQKNILDQMITKFNPRLSIHEKDLIINSIITESQSTSIDPLLIASVIAAESSFRPRAVSPCEARGLMQITSCVSRIMKISNPFDIQQNIYAGTRYLQDLYHQFDQFELILAAYNAGPTRVAKLGRVPRITETLNYIKRVSRFYHNIRNQLLITVNELIGQPVFTPISETIDISQSQVIAACAPIDAPNPQPLIIEHVWCETERSIRFLVNV